MAATRLGLYGGPRADFIGSGVSIVTAAVTGTVGGGALESEIVSDGGTIIVTLTNDTWVTAGATFNAQRQAIIDGLDAASSPATGWNTLIRDVIDVSTVARTSDTVVTITIPATAGYAISSDETITVTVPATALVTSAGDITATPTVAVTAEVEAVDTATGGWAVFSAYEKELQERRDRERKCRLLIEELEKIEDEAAREIAVILHEDDEKAERERDKQRLRALVSQVSEVEIEREFGERVAKAYERAYEKATFSALEALVREAKRVQEEEEFLMLALFTVH